MSNERKYRKRINPDHWMVKVQKFTWGSKTPDFVGYCPFFWFTWFSLVLAPFKIIGMIILAPLLLVGIAIQNLIDKMPSKVRKPTPTIMLHMAEKWQENETSFLEWLERAEFFGTERAWIRATPDWRNCFLAVLLEKESKDAKKAAANSRDKKRLQSLANKLHYIVRPMAWIIGLGAGGTFLFYAYKFVVWAWPFLYWPKIGEVVLIIIVCITAIATFVSIIIGAEYLWNKMRSGCPKDPNRKGFWATVGKCIAIPFSFILETIDAIYTRECPIIEWDEDTGPIEDNL